VVARPIASRGHRGGDGIQTTHALRLRLALIAISAVVAVAVVLAPLLATGSLREDEQFMAVVALAALVFPLVGVARLLPWAVAVLAGSALVGSEHGDVGSVGIALCAGLVLLVGECASAAGDLAPLTRIERRLARRLVLRLAAETVVAGALAAAVLASASLGIPAGLAPLALGLLATMSLLALVAGLVARR
jgi:hypothetical protein